MGYFRVRRLFLLLHLLLLLLLLLFCTLVWRCEAYCAAGGIPSANVDIDGHGNGNGNGNGDNDATGSKTVDLSLWDYGLLANETVIATVSARRYTHIQGTSYFGYSVASLESQSGSFCLVGAPQTVDEGAAFLDDAKTPKEARVAPTGAVYRIDLSPELADCSRVPIATTDEERRERASPNPGG
ncbi:unnamed protein product [Protopolystoma xenopodis]|uniref:Uncharacterized protein n=1 Tax=Protopolystoma xenopodis TaxID=117903 RepID=A0A3S5FDL3_9PLAT|nr:unnamed protein product [Protopolystoma xenopodis]